MLLHQYFENPSHAWPARAPRQAARRQIPCHIAHCAIRHCALALISGEHLAIVTPAALSSPAQERPHYVYTGAVLTCKMGRSFVDPFCLGLQECLRFELHDTSSEQNRDRAGSPNFQPTEMARMMPATMIVKMINMVPAVTPPMPWSHIALCDNKMDRFAVEYAGR